MLFKVYAYGARYTTHAADADEACKSFDTITEGRYAGDYRKAVPVTDALAQALTQKQVDALAGVSRCDSHWTCRFACSGVGRDDLTVIGNAARAVAESLRTLGIVGECTKSEPDFEFAAGALDHFDGTQCSDVKHAIAQRGRYTYPLTTLGRRVWAALTGQGSVE